MSSENSHEHLAQQNQLMAENLAKKVSRLRDVSLNYYVLDVAFLISFLPVFSFHNAMRHLYEVVNSSAQQK